MYVCTCIYKICIFTLSFKNVEVKLQNGEVVSVHVSADLLGQYHSTGVILIPPSGDFGIDSNFFHGRYISIYFLNGTLNTT